MNPHSSGGYMCAFPFPGLFWGKNGGELFPLITEDGVKVIALAVTLSLVVGALAGISAWYGWRKPKE